MVESCVLIQIGGKPTGRVQRSLQGERGKKYLLVFSPVVQKPSKTTFSAHGSPQSYIQDRKSGNDREVVNSLSSSICTPRPSVLTGNSVVWNLSRNSPRVVTSFTIFGESFLQRLVQGFLSKTAHTSCSETGAVVISLIWRRLKALGTLYN